MHRLATALLALLPSLALADGFQAPINDNAIKTKFEKQLGALREADQLVKPETLAAQLDKQPRISRKLPTPADADHDTASVYEQNKKGVLCFGNIYKCDRCEEWHSSIAGGFVISADGLAVTNFHVMKSENAAAFGAMTIDGTLYPVKKVVAASEKDDLAIVQLEGENFHPLTIAKGDSVGAEITVISHPEGNYYTVSEGIISRYYTTQGGKEKGSARMAITADYARGSSGCPVFNDDEAVVGVVASTRSIYYNKKGGIERNLQMVIKSCIPSGSILKLLANTK